MAFEQVGAPKYSLNSYDWKSIGIYAVIVFVSYTLGEVISHNVIASLHQLNPVLEYVEAGFSGIITILSIILKKYLDDNSDIYLKK